MTLNKFSHQHEMQTQPALDHSFWVLTSTKKSQKVSS